jgi:hypothetical protein
MESMSTASSVADGQASWKKFEKIVAAIEKAIAPDAIVEHNVSLDNLSTGHPTQIDVLITYGRAPRQTRAMVEVQDRVRPVEINDFRGWVQKKQDTGVEQLFVVSKHDFPKSIVDAVRKQYGPCVKLMTFKDVERGNWPFEFHLGEFSLMRHTVLQSIGKSAILTEPDLPVGSLSVHGHVFSREGKPNRVSLEDLAEEALLAQGDPSITVPGTHDSLVVIPSQPQLWWHRPNGTFRVKLFIASYRVRRDGIKMPLSVAKYQQIDFNGEPTWVAECEGQFEGKPIAVRFILSSDQQGRFTKYTMQISGFEQVFGRVSHVHMLMAEWPAE